MKKLIWKLLNALGLGPMIQLGWLPNGLRALGWHRSYRSKRSEDANGRPIAWYTYPMLHFLAPRLSDDLCVFEYGSGGGSLWYAQRVKAVQCVEHHQGWYDEVRRSMPQNVQIMHVPLDEAGSYPNAITTTGQAYDIVIVDGRQRNACAYAAVPHLSERGVIIFDNSERAEYAQSIAWLREQGFRQLPFYGMAPVSPVNTETSVFYRDGNCLGI